jgi:hypothetical protein
MSNTNLVAFDLEPRTCGDCHACCVVPEIEHLGKPALVPCRHLCDQGCQIYAERGEVCRGFQCIWLRGAMGVGNRPDKLGVFFNLVELDECTPCIVASEIMPGALSQGIPAWIIRDFMVPATGLALVRPVDGPASWQGTDEKKSRAVLLERSKRLDQIEAAEKAARERTP